MAEPSSRESKPKRFRLTGKRLLGIAVAVLVALRVGVELIPTRVVIGPETTVINGPLRPDGTIDYAAALNDEWGKGVAPDQNAAVDLLRAFGPGIVNESIREAYFARLGIPVPPREGEYFVDFTAFLDAQGISRPQYRARMEEVERQLYTARERPWTAEEFPEVAEWIDRNQQPLDLIVVAAQKPRYFSPIVVPVGSPLLSVSISAEQNARAAASLLISEAMRALGRGNVDRAFELTFACHRLARLVSEHPTLSGKSTAYGIDAVAFAGDAALVLDDAASADQAVDFRQRVRSLVPFRPIAEALDTGERFFVLDVVTRVHSGRLSLTDDRRRPLLLTFGFDPNPILKHVNRQFDEEVQIANAHDRSERERLPNQPELLYDEDTSTSALRLEALINTKRVATKVVGQLIIAQLWPAITQYIEMRERSQMRESLSDIGYTLTAFRADHVEFPEALDALVPQYFIVLPRDIYSGNGLKYRRTGRGFLLYSVGANGIDDGGDGRWPADDIAFGDQPDDGE